MTTTSLMSQSSNYMVHKAYIHTDIYVYIYICIESIYIYIYTYRCVQVCVKSMPLHFFIEAVLGSSRGQGFSVEVSGGLQSQHGRLLLAVVLSALLVGFWSEGLYKLSIPAIQGALGEFSATRLRPTIPKTQPLNPQKYL